MAFYCEIRGCAYFAIVCCKYPCIIRPFVSPWSQGRISLIFIRRKMMSALKFKLEAELRKDIGRGASRRLRQADKVPAVVYGANQEAVSLMLDHNKTMQALANEA